MIMLETATLTVVSDGSSSLVYETPRLARPKLHLQPLSNNTARGVRPGNVNELLCLIYYLV